MNRPSPSLRVCATVGLAAAFWAGCPAEDAPGTGTPDGVPTATGGRGTGGATAPATGGSASGGATATGGAATGGAATGGSAATGGAATGGAASGGATGGSGAGGAGAATGGRATGGQANAGGRGGAATSTGGAGGALPANCNLSMPVSFKKDVEPYLTNSCGKAVGGGCHVTDNMSTTGSGGFDHAYDWITAGSHASSCPETPNPKRFEVVLAVMNGANPSSCSRSRKMPPPGMGTPPTACQMAALETWLALPKVMQMHRADDSSPTTPYLMPPYN
ncbi:MAG: hypothetical protein ABUS79_03030 [Pseudomonadota bacterium]